MSEAIPLLAHAASIGTGATVLMDVWTVVRRHMFKVPALDYALVGRWLLYLSRGRWRHDPIASTQPVAGERPVGWIAHYLTGIVFAVVLVAFAGPAWIEQPTIGPAMAVGVGSVVAPFFLLQPALGAGVAGSRTARPAMARLHSLMTHAIFGLGLYASAWMTSLLAHPVALAG
ncbi:hypothetical protein J2X06_000397 [Lysobacter niastensis]|uniref:DUF2938 domain-containing protein n=1 Tax=Lysobacter niastensis TaxID=380629 RepID=A0ABU1W6J4_9GAMM|nr:DUF2938 domain-containing protein [Lysobacter niastensis]MDR7133213.1 hypothetical protein [Lysobacter niastensis]